MESWYLVSLKAGSDNLFRAELSLHRRQLTFFSPRVRLARERTDRPGSRSVIEPLFCGYLFLELDPEIIHPVKIEEECAGISHFVRYGNEIKPIPTYVVDEMMSLPLCTDAELRMKSRRQQARERKQRYADLQRAHPDYEQTTRHIRNIVNNPDRDVRIAMFLALTEGLSRHLLKESV